MFKALCDDGVADAFAAGVELDLERIAADKQVGVDAFAGGDEHSEAVAVALFAEARERDSAGLEREFVDDALGDDSGTVAQ